MLRFHDWVWFFWAFLILLLPLNWLFAALTAACIHELCHGTAVFMLGGRIRVVTIGAFGTQIEAEGIEGWKELICILAGPAGSLLLLCLLHWFPILGLCGLVQGCFNLLPLRSLDGGRALLLMLELILPEQAERICALIEGTALFLLLFGAVFASCRYSLGVFPVCACILAVLRILLRKRP